MNHTQLPVNVVNKIRLHGAQQSYYLLQVSLCATHRKLHYHTRPVAIHYYFHATKISMFITIIIRLELPVQHAPCSTACHFLGAPSLQSPVSPRGEGRSHLVRTIISIIISV